jgi:hypothetical protein
MGGYGGYGRQNDFMKQIIQELEEVLNELNKKLLNIHSEQYINETGELIYNSVNSFINKNLDSNKTLLEHLSQINFKVSTRDELKIEIEELVQFCTKIKELLIKSKNIEDFNKWLELSIYKVELDSQKKELDDKINELNSLIDNAKNVNNILDEKSKEAFTKILLDKEAANYQHAEIQSRNMSTRWLIGSIIIALILIFIVCNRSTNVSGLIEIRKNLCCLVIQDKTMLYIAYAKYISSYILIYSILIYALKVSIKNYNANKHNEIINKNKFLILSSTFNLFQEGKDPELLYIATRELFTQHSTGYNNTAEEKSTSNIVNTIVDTAAKKV